MSEPMQLRALRGATTASANTVEAIGEAVAELIDSLVLHNHLEGARVLSVTFSVTADLDACFPAAIARRRDGWGAVALLDCQQMAVAGDLPRCIRLLAHAWLEAHQSVVHPYLRGAAALRPDRACPTEPPDLEPPAPSAAGSGR